MLSFSLTFVKIASIISFCATHATLELKKFAKLNFKVDIHVI